MPDAPIDNLVREWAAPDAVLLRADDEGDDNTLYGHFAVYNEWTEINSAYEGRFMERIAPDSFNRTFDVRRDQIRVLYDHGHDPSIGNKPLGVPEVLGSDKRGANYEVPLFKAHYVQELKPAIRSKQLGSSFRFSVLGEEWRDPQRSSDHNPDRIPERTIGEIELYEFGPVTFPAYAGATAGLRSATDRFHEHLLNDPLFVARFSERVGPRVTEHLLAKLPAGRRDVASAEALAGRGVDASGMDPHAVLTIAAALKARQSPRKVAS